MVLYCVRELELSYWGELTTTNGFEAETPSAYPSSYSEDEAAWKSAKKAELNDSEVSLYIWS